MELGDVKHRLARVHVRAPAGKRRRRRERSVVTAQAAPQRGQAHPPTPLAPAAQAPAVVH